LQRLSLPEIPTFGSLAGRGLLLLDQVAFSLGNFALTIILARLYSNTEFGAYGVALSITLVVQFIQRSLYVVSLSLMSQRRARRYLPAILAEHLLIAGSAALLAALGAGLLVACGVGRASIDLAMSILVCTVIYFQAEFDRALLVKRGAFAGALALSLVYLALVLALGALAKRLNIGFEAFMTLLGAGCALKGAWLALLRVAPRWPWGLRMIVADWRHYGWPAVMQAATSLGTQHAPVLILSTLRGSAAVAGLVAMRSLTQPLMLVTRSLDAADKNRVRQLTRGSTAALRRVFWRTTVLYAGIGLAAITVLAAFPEHIIRLAYHEKYAGFGWVMVAWGVYSALLGVCMPTQSVIYVLGRQKAFARLTVVNACVGTGLALALCPSFGVAGAIIAIVVSMATFVVGGMLIIRDLITGHGDAPLPKERRSARVVDRA
jgi:O-antigen/teichoic acid export membrane protein